MVDSLINLRLCLGVGILRASGLPWKYDWGVILMGFQYWLRMVLDLQARNNGF